MSNRAVSVAAGVVALAIVAVLALPGLSGRVAAVFAAPAGLQATPENGAPLPPSVQRAVEGLPAGIEVTLLASAEMGGLRSSGNLLTLDRVRLAAGGRMTAIAAGSELVTVDEGEITLRLGGQAVAIAAGAQFVASPGDAIDVTAGASGATLLRLRLEPAGLAATPVAPEASPAPGPLPELLVSGEANRLVSRRGTLFIARVVLPPGAETGEQAFSGPVGVHVVSGDLSVRRTGDAAVEMLVGGDAFLPGFSGFNAINNGDQPVELMLAGLLAPPSGDARGPEGAAAASPTADALASAQADLTAMASNLGLLATRESDAAETAIALQTRVAGAETGAHDAATAIATAEANLTAIASDLATARAQVAAGEATAVVVAAAVDERASALEATIVALQTQVAEGSASLRSAQSEAATAADAAASAAGATSAALTADVAAAQAAAANAAATSEADRQAAAVAASAAAATAAADLSAEQAARATAEAQASAAAATVAAQSAELNTAATTIASGAAGAQAAATTAATDLTAAQATAAAYATALAGEQAAGTAAAEAANASASAAAGAASATIAAQAAAAANQDATIAAGELVAANQDATIAALTTAQAEAAGQAQASVNPNYVQETIQVDLDGVLAGNEQATTAARGELRRVLRKYKDTCRAGVVLTFGHGRTIGEGTRLAQAINGQIRALYPTAFGRAGYDAFGDLNGPLGQVDIRIYFFTGCAPAEQPAGATPTPTP